MKKLCLSMICMVGIAYAQEVMKFEPSNYYVNENGDTVLILPKLPLIIPELNTGEDSSFLDFGTDANLTYKKRLRSSGFSNKNNRTLFICLYRN